MDRYKRVEKPKDDNKESPEYEIRVTNRLPTGKQLGLAMYLLTEKNYDEIVLSAMGSAINRAIILSEIIKGKVPGIQQTTNSGSVEVKDKWEPLEEGLLPLETAKKLPVVTITLKKGPVDPNTPEIAEVVHEDSKNGAVQGVPSRARGRGGYRRGWGRGRGKVPGTRSEVAGENSSEVKEPTEKREEESSEVKIDTSDKVEPVGQEVEKEPVNETGASRSRGKGRGRGRYRGRGRGGRGVPRARDSEETSPTADVVNQEASEKQKPDEDKVEVPAEVKTVDQVTQGSTVVSEPHTTGGNHGRGRGRGPRRGYGGRWYGRGRGRFPQQGVRNNGEALKAEGNGGAAPDEGRGNGSTLEGEANASQVEKISSDGPQKVKDEASKVLHEVEANSS